MSVYTCPCCGSPVRVHQGGEGTSSYEPVVPADALGQEGSSPKHSPVEAREALGGVGEVDAREEPRGAAAFESARRRGHRAPPADALDKAREDIEGNVYLWRIGETDAERAMEAIREALAALPPKAEPVCGRASGVRCTVPLCPYPACDAFLPGYAGPRE